VRVRVRVRVRARVRVPGSLRYRLAHGNTSPSPRLLPMPSAPLPVLCVLRTTTIGIALIAALAASPAKATEPCDLNNATQARIEQVKGIGVALSERLLQARAAAPFADWADLMARVPGVGQRVAERWSRQGVTVNGQPFGAAAAAPAAGPSSSPSNGD
jgi:competence protein ComEA